MKKINRTTNIQSTIKLISFFTPFTIWTRDLLANWNATSKCIRTKHLKLFINNRRLSNSHRTNFSDVSLRSEYVKTDAYKKGQLKKMCIQPRFMMKK